MAVCVRLEPRERLRGLPVGRAVGALDRLAEVAVAPGHRVLPGEHPDLQRVAAGADAAPPPDPPGRLRWS